MTLRWEKQSPEAWFGYSGEILIGMVVERLDGAIAWNASNGVHMRWTAKTDGTAKSFTSGKRAVERSWKRWLECANLQPRSGEGVDC